jgi:hypothetical protein
MELKYKELSGTIYMSGRGQVGYAQDDSAELESVWSFEICTEYTDTMLKGPSRLGHVDSSEEHYF